MTTPTFDLLVRAHLVFGSVALAGFWLQMVTRKRGRLHRRVGQVYFLAMSGVVVTAVPMTAYLARGDNWGAALLLAFLAWITIAAGAGSWLAARWRGRRLEAQRRYGVAASVGLLAISLAMLALFSVGGALFIGLGAFGAWAAVADLRRPRNDVVWRSWQVRHVEGVIGTGMAVHIAFFAFGLRGLLGASYGNVHFLLAFAVPVVLGTWATHRLTRSYRTTHGNQDDDSQGSSLGNQG